MGGGCLLVSLALLARSHLPCSPATPAPQVADNVAQQEQDSVANRSQLHAATNLISNVSLTSNAVTTVYILWCLQSSLTPIIGMPFLQHFMVPTV